MKIYAETERLILREIVPEDRHELFAIDSDPEVNIYLGKKPIQNIEQTDDIIQFIRKQYLDNGIGRWAMIEKSTNTFIGWSGLKLVCELINEHINYYDLGYRLNKNSWGKGYATEAARATVNYGFNELNLNNIYAIADSQNSVSKHVLEKTGLSYVETFTYENTDHDWYEISRTKNRK